MIGYEHPSHKFCYILLHPLQDKDGLRKEEVAALSGPNELAEFYNRLKQIKEFHKKHPNEVSHSSSPHSSLLSVSGFCFKKWGMQLGLLSVLSLLPANTVLSCVSTSHLPWRKEQI